MLLRLQHFNGYFYECRSIVIPLVCCCLFLAWQVYIDLITGEI